MALLLLLFPDIILAHLKVTLSDNFLSDMK